MNLPSAIAIYFIVWWLCLFMVLPFGVRNAHEAGETVAEGHEAGAPVKPMLWRKMAATTLLATIIFAIVYGQMRFGWISFEDIPFLSRMPAG
jgi:predicted secreted protein